MQTYIILGDSRSGTSLIGRILHKNGVSMGKTFRGGHIINPNGYFEDELLKRFQDVFSQMEEDERYLQAAKIVDSLKTEKWGMKNPPWLTFQYKYFSPYLDEVKFIVCERNRQDQIKSIKNAINSSLTEEDALARIDRTHREIEKIIEGEDFIRVQFEDWFVRPQQTMKELCEFVDIPYEKKLVKRFIDPKLWRFHG